MSLARGVPATSLHEPAAVHHVYICMYAWRRGGVEAWRRGGVEAWRRGGVEEVI